MAKKKILINHDFNQNEIQKATVENLASAPSSPKKGQIYYDTTLNMFGVYNNTTWIYLYLASTAATANNVILRDGSGRAQVADPAAAADIATKGYVDAIQQGISWKNAVRVATTANGTLGTAYANGQTVDGVTLATGDRILIKNQSTGSENGIYTVNSSGAPTRASDADNAAELKQAAVFVQEGTANADSGWVCTVDGAITVGTTALTFVQFTNASVNFASAAEAEAKSLSNKAVPPSALTNFGRVYTSQITGDGTTTSWTVTHNLNTRAVIVSVSEAASPYDEVVVGITRSTVNAIAVVTDTPFVNSVVYDVTVIAR